VAAEVGEVRGDRMALRLDVEIDDLAAFLADPRHRARLTGWVDCPLLGGTRPVTGGTVALLPECVPGRGSAMEYRFRTSDRSGRALRVVGTKAVAAVQGSSAWRDTTTLDLRVHLDGGDSGDGVGSRDGGDGGDGGEPVLGGRLRIGVVGVVRMLGALRGTGGPGFIGFFARRLARLYLHERPAPAAAVDDAAPVPALEGWPEAERPEGARVFVHNERIVPGPPRRVFEVLTAAGRWPSFYPNALFVRVSGSREGRLRPGAVFRWLTFGQPITCRVTTFDERGGRLGWSWDGTGARGHHLWALTADAEGTRIVTQETQRGFLPRLTAPLLRPVMLFGHDAWLRGIGRQVARA
jgi:uncharacterized protein YndB with AHSA1/START domain